MTADRRHGTYRVPGDDRVYVLPQDIKALDAAWDAYLGTRTVPDDPDLEDDSRGEGRADPAQKARRDEALAYVRDYRGSWGLILDLRTPPPAGRWGTKHFRLSERQVEVILAAKARDAERAAARDPRQAEVVDHAVRAIAQTVTQRRPPDFVLSVIAQHNANRTLSARQLEALERWTEETSHEATRGASLAQSPAPEAPGLAPQSPAGSTVARRPGPAAEGWYRVDGVIYKVQKAVHGSGQLYAKRLTVADGTGVWEYAKGMVYRLTADDRLTIEEAEAFGKLYGVCGICGKTLTDEKSIARGIGPVCAARLS